LILKNGLLTPNFFSFGEEREKNGSTVCLVTMKTLIIGYGNQGWNDDEGGRFIHIPIRARPEK
jgi:hypothetical protein